MLGNYLLLLLTGINCVRGLHPNLASPTVATATPTLLSHTTISTNVAAYVNSTDEYYLGYHSADYAKPFAKYYNPQMVPISNEVSTGLQMSPYASVSRWVL